MIRKILVPSLMMHGGIGNLIVVKTGTTGKKSSAEEPVGRKITEL
jgi:hypothetical protein